MSASKRARPVDTPVRAKLALDRTDSISPDGMDVDDAPTPWQKVQITEKKLLKFKRK